MLIDKMKTIISGSLTGAMVVALIIAAFSILPAIVLLCINYLASSGGSEFHIPHGLFNYFVVLILLLILGLIR